MRIFLMTDLEAVAGVIDFENWCTPQSRYNDQAKELLTEEVNAAIDGFFRADVIEVMNIRADSMPVESKAQLAELLCEKSLI